MTPQSTPSASIEPSRKVRTAAAAIFMNLFLTVIKFTLFFFTGSMAILAEAWHSFTDIATSTLVLFAVQRSDQVSKKPDTPQSDEMADETADEKTGPLNKLTSRSELLISLGIGILLAIIAGSLIFKFFQTTPRIVDNALVAGFLFLIFSIGSYYIYHFETRIGKEEGSIGLISDGMHARADMTASLLTGFSLILYAVGLNLDRWVAGLIALFIMSYAVETIVNTVLMIIRRDPEFQPRYRSSDIIIFLFNPKNIKNHMNTLKGFLESKGFSRKYFQVFFKTLSIVFCSIIILSYLSTAVFTVGVRESAVVERFGKPLTLTEPLKPGIHLKFPWPIDHVCKVSTSDIKALNIGNITDKNNRALIWARRHGTEEAFISGDNNFFYPYIVLHYRINNMFHYVYRHKNPKLLINEIGHQLATRLFSQDSFYDIATTHRRQLEQKMLTELQRRMDEIKCGIELLSVNFKDIHPPIFVADSFEKVIAGFQEKKKVINEALGYRNKVVPDSRGNAQKMLEESHSYITDRILKAEGEAARFALSLPGTRDEKKITMRRIHLHTIRDVLKVNKKIVIDPDLGEPDVWMDSSTINPMMRWE